MQNILVTGGSGFLGSNLCKRLLEQNNKVIALDNNYTGNMDNIKDLLNNKNFSFIKYNVSDNLLDIFKEKIDQIYNFACPASPKFYQGKHAINTIKTSVLGAINTLELAKTHNATIMQASTSEVYGDPLIHPQKEDYKGNVNPIGIRSCYDEGKRCAESLFFDYHRLYNVNIKIVRIFNTYGTNMDINDGRVVSNFINQALMGGVLAYMVMALKLDLFVMWMI